MAVGQLEKTMRKTKVIVTLGVLATLTAVYIFWPSSEAKVEYQTSPAVHGNLFVSVSASGTLEPTNLGGSGQRAVGHYGERECR